MPTTHKDVAREHDFLFSGSEGDAACHQLCCIMSCGAYLGPKNSNTQSERRRVFICAPTLTYVHTESFS